MINVKSMLLVVLVLLLVTPLNYSTYDDFDEICCLNLETGNVENDVARFCNGQNFRILGFSGEENIVQGVFNRGSGGSGFVANTCGKLVLDRGMNCLANTGRYQLDRFYISVDGLNLPNFRGFPNTNTCVSYISCSGDDCAWYNEDGSSDFDVIVDQPTEDSQAGVIIVPREEEETIQISDENLGLRPFGMVQRQICERSNLPFGGVFMSRTTCENINDDCVYDPLRAGVLTQAEGDSRSQGLFSRLLPDIMCVSKSNRISSCEDINSKQLCNDYGRLNANTNSLIGLYGCEWREVNSQVGMCITSGLYFENQADRQNNANSKGIFIAQSILRDNFVTNPIFEVEDDSGGLFYWEGTYSRIDTSNGLFGLHKVRLNSGQEISQLISGIPARANFEVKVITNNPSQLRVSIDSQFLVGSQERPLFEFNGLNSDLTLMVFEFSNDLEFANRDLTISSTGNVDIYGISVALPRGDASATLRRIMSSVYPENLFPENSFDCKLCNSLSTIGVCTQESLNGVSKCSLISSSERTPYQSPATQDVNPYVTQLGLENVFVEEHMVFCGLYASQDRCEDENNFLNKIMSQYHNTNQLCRWAVDPSLTNGGHCFKDSSGDSFPDTINNGVLTQTSGILDVNTILSNYNLEQANPRLNDFQLSCDTIPPRVFMQPYKRTLNSVGPVTDLNRNEVGVIEFVYVRIENYQSPACSVFETLRPNIMLVFDSGVRFDAEDLFPEFNNSFSFFERVYSYSQFRNLLISQIGEDATNNFFQTGHIEVYDQSGNKQANRASLQIGELASRPEFDFLLTPASQLEMYGISSVVVNPRGGSSLEFAPDSCDVMVIDVEDSLEIMTDSNISFTRFTGQGYQIGQRVLEYELSRREFNEERESFPLRVRLVCRDQFGQEEFSLKSFNFISNNGILVHQFSNDIFNSQNIPYLNTQTKSIFLNMSGREGVSCTNSYIRGISLNPGSEVDPEVHFNNAELEGIDFSISPLSQYVLAIAVGLVPQDQRFDVTNTGSVTTQDALEILRVQVGLQPSDESYREKINQAVQIWENGLVEEISQEFSSFGPISFSQTSNIEGYPQRFEEMLDFSNLITQDGIYEYVLECTFQGEPFTRSLKFEYNTQNVDISSLKIVERDDTKWKIVNGDVYIDAVDRNLIANNNIVLTSEFNNYIRTRLKLFVDDLGDEVQSISICNNENFEINRLNPIITQDIITLDNDEGCRVEFIEEDSILKFTSPIRVTNNVGNVNEKIITTYFEVIGPRIDLTTTTGGMVIDDVLYFNTNNPQFQVNLGLASFREFNCEISLDVNSNEFSTQRSSTNSNINFDISDITSQNVLQLPNTQVYLNLLCQEELFGRSDSLRVRLEQDTQPPQIEQIRFLEMGRNWAYPLAGSSSIRSDVEIILLNDENFVSCRYMVTDESSTEFVVNKNLRTATSSNSNLVVDSDALILTRTNSEETPLVTISSSDSFSINQITHSVDVVCVDAAGNEARRIFDDFRLSLLNFGEIQVTGRGDSSNNLLLRVTSLTPLDGAILTIRDERRDEIFFSGLLDGLDVETAQSGSVFEIVIRNIKSLLELPSTREYPFSAEFSFNQGMQLKDQFEVLIDNEKPTIKLNINTNDGNVIFGNTVSGSLIIQDGPDFSRGLRSVEIELLRNGATVDIIELNENLGFEVTRNILYEELEGGDYTFMISAVDMFGNSELLTYSFELNDGFGVRLLTSNNVYLNELAPLTWYTQNRFPTLRFETFKSVESCTLRPGVEGGYIGSSYEFTNTGSNIYELNLQEVSGFQIRDGKHKVVISCVGFEGDNEDVGDVGVFLYFIHTIPDYSLNIDWGRTIFIRPGESTRSFNVSIEQKAAFRDVLCDLTLINSQGSRDSIELQERFSEDIGSYIANLNLPQGRYSLELVCSTPTGVSGPIKMYEFDVVREDFRIDIVSMNKESNGLEINVQNSPILVPRPQSFNEDSSTYSIEFSTNFQEELICSVDTSKSGIVNFVRSLFINTQVEAQKFPQTLDLYQSVIEIDSSTTSIDISCIGEDGSFSSRTFRFPIELFDESGYQISSITVEGER